MMIMKNKKGYTIIESVIAMLLVSVVVGGIFSALMASRRAIIEPSYKEEMIFAIESANNLLKNYVTADNNSVQEDLRDGLCGGETVATVLSESDHDIKCMLPPVCDVGSSSFTYTVSKISVAAPGVTGNDANTDMKVIKFKIMCNREVL